MLGRITCAATAGGLFVAHSRPSSRCITGGKISKASRVERQSLEVHEDQTVMVVILLIWGIYSAVTWRHAPACYTFVAALQQGRSGF